MTFDDDFNSNEGIYGNSFIFLCGKQPAKFN